MMEKFYHLVRYVMQIIVLIFKLISYNEFSKKKDRFWAGKTEVALGRLDGRVIFRL